MSIMERPTSDDASFMIHSSRWWPRHIVDQTSFLGSGVRFPLRICQLHRHHRPANFCAVQDIRGTVKLSDGEGMGIYVSVCV